MKKCGFLFCFLPFVLLTGCVGEATVAIPPDTPDGTTSETPPSNDANGVETQPKDTSDEAVNDADTMFDASDVGPKVDGASSDGTTQESAPVDATSDSTVVDSPSDSLLDVTADSGQLLEVVETPLITTGGHACAVAGVGANNQVLCWGSGSDGQLGNGNGVFSSTPVIVSGLSNVISVAAGNGYSCALSNKNKVFCWGRTNDDVLGVPFDGVTSRYTVPIYASLFAPHEGKIRQLFAGSSHTCIWTNSNQIYCVGHESERGAGSNAGKLAEVKFPGMTGSIRGTASKEGHSCVWTSTEIWCWGNNSHGQASGVVPNPGAPESTLLTPVRVQNIAFTDIRMVATGSEFTCAQDGQYLFCWGFNSDAQLGKALPTGPLENVASPGVAPIKPSAVGSALLEGLYAGSDHVCARYRTPLTDAGTTSAVYCWGSSDQGQLGNGLKVPATTPTMVLATDVGDSPHFSLGQRYTCQHRDIANKKVYCWGANFGGTLGRGTAGNAMLDKQPILIP